MQHSITDSLDKNGKVIEDHHDLEMDGIKFYNKEKSEVREIIQTWDNAISN
jgi:phage terminase large subunit-like protein